MSRDWVAYAHEVEKLTHTALIYNDLHKTKLPFVIKNDIIHASHSHKHRWHIGDVYPTIARVGFQGREA